MSRSKDSFALSCIVAIVLLRRCCVKAIDADGTLEDYSNRIFFENNEPDDDRYMLYSRKDEISLNTSIAFFLNYIDPCGSPNATFSNFTISHLERCQDDSDEDQCKLFLYFIHSGFNEEPRNVTDEILSLRSTRKNSRKQLAFTKDDMKDSMIRLSYHTGLMNSYD
uniref:Uncharacterized protein n=1 Tax=Steinernema glaseri TaxID=37863 RepID=A0A1I7YRH0_9BILA